MQIYWTEHHPSHVPRPQSTHTSGQVSRNLSKCSWPQAEALLSARVLMLTCHHWTRQWESSDLPTTQRSCIVKKKHSQPRADPENVPKHASRSFPMTCVWVFHNYPSFTFIKRLFSSSSLSAITVVSSAYLRLLIFLPVILILACVSHSGGTKYLHISLV